MSSEIADFQDLSMFAGGNSNIDIEIELLKSRTMAATVVDDLNLTVSYYKEGRVKESEVYDCEVTLKEVDNKLLIKETDTTFYVHVFFFYRRVFKLGRRSVQSIDQNRGW